MSMKVQVSGLRLFREHDSEIIWSETLESASIWSETIYSASIWSETLS